MSVDIKHYDNYCIAHSLDNPELGKLKFWDTGFIAFAHASTYHHPKRYDFYEQTLAGVITAKRVRPSLSIIPQPEDPFEPLETLVENFLKQKSRERRSILDRNATLTGGILLLGAGDYETKQNAERRIWLGEVVRQTNGFLKQQPLVRIELNDIIRIDYGYIDPDNQRVRVVHRGLPKGGNVLETWYDNNSGWTKQAYNPGRVYNQMVLEAERLAID